MKSLAKRFDWIPRVYDHTSGYVRFSDKHIFAGLHTAGPEAERTVYFLIAAQDNPLPDAAYLEVLNAFGAALTVFREYLESWIFTTRRTPSERAV